MTETATAGEVESKRFGSPTGTPSSASFLMELSLANGVVTARGAVDGGPLSPPVIGSSPTSDVRIKCGIEYARATDAGASLKQSIDWLEVRHCP